MLSDWLVIVATKKEPNSDPNSPGEGREDYLIRLCMESRSIILINENLLLIIKIRKLYAYSYVCFL